MKSILLALLAATGCSNTILTHTVSVTKDANGNVIQRTESESITKPIGYWSIKPEMHVKAAGTNQPVPPIGRGWMGK